MIEINEDNPLTEGRFVKILNDRLGIKDEEYPVCLVLTEKHLLGPLIAFFEELKLSMPKSKKAPSAIIGPKYKKALQEQKHADTPPTKTTDNVSENKQPPVISRLIKIKEVCKRVGFARPTIYKKMREGVFPKKVKKGVSTFWKELEINAYIEGTWKPTEDEAKDKETDE